MSGATENNFNFDLMPKDEDFPGHYNDIMEHDCKRPRMDKFG